MLKFLSCAPDLCSGLAGRDIALSYTALMCNLRIAVSNRGFARQCSVIMT